MATQEDLAGLTDEQVDVTMVNEKELKRNPRLAAQIEATANTLALEEVEARRIPKRPKRSANVDAWVEYCVALGASKHDLTKETEHTVSGPGVDSTVIGTYTSPAYEKQELIDLANRLGG